MVAGKRWTLLCGAVVALTGMLTAGTVVAQEGHMESPLSRLKVKAGPVEIVPYLHVGVESHSNIYLTTEDTPERIPNLDPSAPPGSTIKNPFLDVSGVLLKVDPGVRIFVRPQKLRVKNLYVGFNYVPQVTFFPQAPRVQLIPGAANPFSPTGEKPDRIYINHHASLDTRYNIGKRFLTISAGASYDQPDLAASHTNFKDIRYYGGVRAVVARQADAELTYRRQYFREPNILLVKQGDTYVEVSPDHRYQSALGSFISSQYEGKLNYHLSPLLTASGFYRYEIRDFYGVRVTPLDDLVNNPLPWDINRDGIPETEKTYEQYTVGGAASAQIHPRIRVNGMLGYAKRDMEARQFGADSYDTIVGRLSVSTSFAGLYWTRLQGFFDHTITDTYRDMSPYENNAFTDPELGAFTLLPDDFSAAFTTRAVIDIVQLVHQRGDQVLVGFAYQRDRLKDVLNRSLNLFGSDLTAQQRARRYQEVLGHQNYEAWIPVRTQEMFMVTGGYRLKVKKWLGVEARGVYYNGDFNVEVETDPNRPGVDPGKADYFAFLGGFVINLNVF